MAPFPDPHHRFHPLEVRLSGPDYEWVAVFPYRATRSSGTIPLPPVLYSRSEG